MGYDGGVVWRRLEPHARSTDIGPGLAAECADPLWLVARQLQLGELTASDGGSPIVVDIHKSWSRITRFRAGSGGTAQVVDDASGPIEALVEREAELAPGAGGAWGPRLRAGRDLDRRLRAGHLAALADRFRSDQRTAFRPSDAAPDQANGVTDDRYRALLRGRAIDGGLVLALTQGDAPLPRDLVADLAPEQRQSAYDIIKSWRTDADATWGIADPGRAHSPSWAPDRLEYAFSLAAPPLPGGDGSEIVLRADEYDGTGLDWYSADLITHPGPNDSLGAATPPGGGAGLTGSEPQTVLAAPLTFRGAPADRFWEFEDSSVSLGGSGAGPTSLARLVTIEFAVAYSPDWFLAPLELPVGSVARVDWVVVRDTFGVATLVGTACTQAGDGRGRQFQPSSHGARDGDHPLLVVLPSSLGPLRSPPREQVSFQRDELANMAWAIERTVAGPSGRGVDRRWSPTELTLPRPTVGGAGDLVWRLATPVPSTWVPLLPGFLDAGDGRPRPLRRDGVSAKGGTPPTGPRVLIEADLLDTLASAPRSSLSTVLAGFTHVREEEVTGRGLQITVHHQLARWHDGGTFIWRGRERRPGQGGASSDLRYDDTTPWLA